MSKYKSVVFPYEAADRLRDLMSSAAGMANYSLPQEDAEELVRVARVVIDSAERELAGSDPPDGSVLESGTDMSPSNEVEEFLWSQILYIEGGCANCGFKYAYRGRVGVPDVSPLTSKLYAIPVSLKCLGCRFTATGDKGQGFKELLQLFTEPLTDEQRELLKSDGTID